MYSLEYGQTPSGPFKENGVLPLPPEVISCEELQHLYHSFLKILFSPLLSELFLLWGRREARKLSQKS